MAVPLKRVAGVAIEAEPVPEQEPDTSAADRMLAGTLQLADHREALIHDIFPRLGKGLQLWAEKKWEWEEPDWEADPSTWPPLARLLWLWLHANEHLSHALFLTHLPAHPGWCEACHPDEKKPARWTGGYVCPDHSSPRAVLTLAVALGEAKKELPDGNSEG